MEIPCESRTSGLDQELEDVDVGVRGLTGRLYIAVAPGAAAAHAALTASHPQVVPLDAVAEVDLTMPCIERAARRRGPTASGATLPHDDLALSSRAHSSMSLPANSMTRATVVAAHSLCLLPGPKE